VSTLSDSRSPTARARSVATGLSGGTAIPYQLLLESSPDAIFAHKDRRIFYANRSAAALIGVAEPADLLGRDPLEFLDPDECAEGARLIAHLQSAGGVLPIQEQRCVRADGASIDVEVTAAAFDHDGGRAIELVVHDIRKRKAAEAAMKESQARIRAIFDESSIGMLLVDSTGRCVATNRALQRLLGYDETELAAMTVRDFTYPDDLGLTGVALKDFFAGRTGAFEMEKRYVRKDGSVLPGYIHVSPVRDEDGIVRYSATIIEDISARTALESELREQAERDPLSGLPNRAGFASRLTAALNSPEPITVLYIDIDDFRIINDTFGHAAGDRVLVEAASRIGAGIRSRDIAARLGGDEFAVILPGVTPTEAEAIATRILDGLSPAMRLDERLVYVHASIGIAIGTPGKSSEDMMREADVAMYMAKGQGKGRYQRFEAKMHADVLRQMALSSEVEGAIAKGEFVLHFQPIVSFCKRNVLACEALVRWQHPERGLLGPLEFIGLAEETGLIVPLGRWILGEACRVARTWLDELGDAAPAVTVNVSVVQFRHPAFMSDVATALADSGLPPDRLVLELTESILIDTDNALATLTQLRALGIRIALDDFGTGYSSLAYLTRYPIDILKIDRSFVTALGTGDRDDRLAAAIVNLGHDLRIEVIAEGVETEAQLERLSMLGCAWQQGFLITRPLSAEALTDMLRNWPWQLPKPVAA
jgi:diguanylate cyclase (GGDEF)-like protein/PAS domain S-box-containing protein